MNQDDLTNELNKAVVDTQPFLFDDFFVDDSDPGIEEVLTFGKREVPITIYRNLSLHDYQSCEKKAVKTKINKAGQMEVVSIDEEEFAVQVLSKIIKSWPFTHKNGKSVPVTPENLRKMNIQGGQQLALLVQKVLGAQRSGDDFFESKSAEVS